jgi:hypothetical protein
VILPAPSGDNGSRRTLESTLSDMHLADLRYRTQQRKEDVMNVVRFGLTLTGIPADHEFRPRRRDPRHLVTRQWS